jgi:hypothetical protein
LADNCALVAPSAAARRVGAVIDGPANNDLPHDRIGTQPLDIIGVIVTRHRC